MIINKKEYLKKVSACWTGKNIGGTMGAPYEGKKEMIELDGFTTKKGEPLPNDDLDLQLVWLRAVEDYGIRAVNPHLLGEYWIDYITAPWNEYGICKANMRAGILPPMSGEVNNDKWKHSNGAWIRTEIWACLFPGYPELAAHYAYFDACVDHGMGEGTYAAMFVAALESLAFTEKDIRALIDSALSFIPETTLTAKSIKKAVELYDEGKTLAEARELIVDETKELGYFMAPANVAFVILGLLFGEGDYKKSMIAAISCGDDTDCTGATIGSVMGIMNGEDCVPQDWADYIGDSIKSVAIDLSALYKLPTSCAEMTERVAALMPACLNAYGLKAELSDGETAFEPLENIGWRHLFYVPDFPIPNTGLSVDFPDLIYARGRVELSKYKVSAGDELDLKFIFENVSRDIKYIHVTLTLPEGFSADVTESVLCLQRKEEEKDDFITRKITVLPEAKNGKNVIYAHAKAEGRITEAVVPIVLFIQ